MSIQEKDKKILLKWALAKNVSSQPITAQAKKIYSPEMIGKEADQIFIKNNQTWPLTKYKNRITGMYPKVDQTNENTPYGKEYKRVLDQVTKTRQAMSK